jgi:acetyltransferase-like isoleucine patch superfamily enzyme
MTKRHVDLPETAESTHSAFVAEVDDRLSGDEPLPEVVADVLVDLHGDREARDRVRAGEAVSAVERARVENHDPRNATLESEYYAEKDEAAFADSKPLQYLWRGFDRSPLADNVDLALEFRRMLADHLFAEVGEDVRIFSGVTMTYGHNVELGDNVVIHDDVHLDDRGRLTVGDRASLADGTHVYSHSHDVVDQTEVTNYHTVIADDARLGYDSVVQAGHRVGENAFVGSRALVTSDVPDHHVAVGMPAESVRVKPGWESVADPPDGANVDRRERRLLPYDLDLAPGERFDEFQRDRHPPDA